MSVATALALEPTTLSAAAFEARFSDLIELICDAAQAGRVEPLMDAQYTVLRAWLYEHFPSVVPHLPSDAPGDFEPLFHPPTLAAILADDQGELMGYLMRTQHAICAWKNAQ
jgi:hypothetical protein